MELKHLRAIERFNLLFAAVICLGSLLFWRRGIALGACIGALLSVVNFWSIRRVVQAGLQTRTQGRKVRLVALLVLKMAALIGLVFVVIHYLPINVLAFIVGLSTFLISIMLVSFRVTADAAET